MNFAFGEEQELLRSTTRAFLAKRHPLGRLRSLLEIPDKVHRNIWQAGADLGWTAMLVPADCDGGSVTDQPLVDLVVLAEELGRVLYPAPFVPTNVVADAIAREGPDEQRKELLGPIARGECLAAWCLSGDGSPDVAAVAVRATPHRDGYRLDGRAAYVHGASDADVLLVTATTGDELLNCVLPVACTGVSIRALDGLDLTRSLGVVELDGAVVPHTSALVGGDPTATIARALDVATVLEAAEAVGGADHLLDVTIQYLQDRVQFGRPIASFQAIKHRLADMKICVEGMRAAVHYAALALGDGLDDAEEAVSTAGAYVFDTYAALCGEALQLHGGIGFTWEHDVHLFVRRAKVSQVLYGDGAWHRERLCARVEATTPAPAG